MLVRQMCGNGSLGALTPTLIPARPYFFWSQGKPPAFFVHIEQPQSLQKKQVSNQLLFYSAGSTSHPSYSRVQTYAIVNDEQPTQSRAK
jgi:hypothetical protein